MSNAERIRGLENQLARLKEMVTMLEKELEEFKSDLKERKI